MAGTNTTGYSSQLFSGLLAARGINSPTINAGIQSAIAGQNQANKANQQRYDQGLSTLQGGSDKAAGLLQSATNQIATNGQAGYNRIDLQQQQGTGNAQQAAVSRGLTGTTIQDAMTRGVQRDANDARLALGESINRQQAAAKDAQAAQASQGAGAISNWIGARTDEGPNMGLLAQMVQGAASDPRTQRTGTVQRNSVPGLGGAAGNNGLPSSFGGGAQAPAGYFAGPDAGGVGTGNPAMGASSFGMGGMGGFGGGSAQAGPLQSALSPQAPATIQSALSAPPTPGAAADAVQADASKPDNSVYMANASSGSFTKSQWEALTPEQQKNVLAGRKPGDGASAMNG